MIMKEAAFLSEFKVLDVADGKEVRMLELEQPFQVYSAVLDAIITVPAGFRFDGESIPTVLHWLVPPFGQSKRGACVHDYLYRYHGFHTISGELVPVSRKEADAVYFELVRAKGLSSWRAHIRWAALRGVGWIAWRSSKLAIFAAMLLSSCSGDIAGLKPAQRDEIYAGLLTAGGHREYIYLIYGARKLVTSAKNPQNVSP